MNKWEHISKIQLNLFLITRMNSKQLLKNRTLDPKEQFLLTGSWESLKIKFFTGIRTCSWCSEDEIFWHHHDRGRRFRILNNYRAAFLRKHSKSIRFSVRKIRSETKQNAWKIQNFPFAQNKSKLIQFIWNRLQTILRNLDSDQNPFCITWMNPKHFWKTKFLNSKNNFCLLVLKKTWKPNFLWDSVESML